MDPDSSLWIIRLVALAALCAFFTLSETAMVTLNDQKLRKLAATGHKKAMMVAALVDCPTRFFATNKVGFALFGFFAFAVAIRRLSWYIMGWLWRLLLPVDPQTGNVFFTPTDDVERLQTIVRWLNAVDSAFFILAGLIAGLLILVLCDIVPKRVAVRHHESIAFACARPLTAFTWLARPFVALLSVVSGGILRVFGIDPHSTDDSLPEEEIRMLLDEGSEEGSIEEDEKDMINNIFDFEDTEVAELMVHRTEIVALELEYTLHEVVQTAIGGGCTRMPVYKGDLDNIVGILNVKDLIELMTRGPDHPFEIQQYLREPFYAMESMSCKLLFETFKEKKIQMAVVVDEYGGTAGIITMEDLLEGIVGSIQDEYDDEEEEICSTEAGVYQIDGVADLEEVCETLGLELEEEVLEECETIGGYIVHELGRIPGEDEQPSIQIGDVRFTVEVMEDRRIARLKAEITMQSAEGAEDKADVATPAE